jgi:ATP-dependent helicase/nuclease subunit B
MAEPSVFGLPPGVDFPAALVAGLIARMADQPVEAMARVTLILNTQRMRREVGARFQAHGARFLPRLMLLTEVASLGALPQPPGQSALRRRLDLAVLLDKLLETGTTDFPRTALFDLADSLATLMAEMEGEGVPPERIAALDVSSHSAHWARTQAFLGIVSQAMAGDTPDAEAQLRQAVLALTAGWSAGPPNHPVILAGSTGSRGTTALLMQAVARLPHGAVVLPGFDFDLPDPVWNAMSDAMTAEDHPQYRFRRLMEALGINRDAVQRWTTTEARSPGRNRLISLSLRPAPVTDQWRVEGPDLPDLPTATDGMTLVEAPNERAEALAIALILRQAAGTDQTAALVTPDRTLTRRVTAALDRWGIRPDDSAGKPLALSAPGRMLRLVAGLFGQRLTVDMALALLKHPLAFSGQGSALGRGQHLILTREYELFARANGPAFPTAESLRTWAEASDILGAKPWAALLGQVLCGHEEMGALPLATFVARHLDLASRLARGFADTGDGGLWDKEAGKLALAVMTELAAEADVATGALLTSGDYQSLFRSILQRHEVRETESVHPRIMIWGTLEARVQGADLVILGGLNDSVWPASPPPDPWLNRSMRKAAGLLLPERQIGLSAHDYQQAVAAPKVVLTRALRGAEAATVPSRWVNRLVNLMAGLPERHGPEALAAMRRRGQDWLDLAAALDTPVERVPPATRPSPKPPVEARPKRLAVTEIKTLIRDPFAIYAKHILRLRPLAPLRPEADPRLRGTVVHEILERFLRQGGESSADLLAIAGQVLDARVAWPLARAIWRARIEKAAAAFLAFSSGTGGKPVLIEEKGAVTLPALGFTLTGKPDRIDRLDDGRLLLIDYKTGTPPSTKQQEEFDKQLLLLAAMAEQGGFAELGPAEVAQVAFVGLKADPKVVSILLEPGQIAETWARFGKLISTYARPGKGYTARRAMELQKDPSDYDHLSRFGEWHMSDKVGGGG